MKKSGYQASLEYIEPKVDNTENNTKKLQRKRKIIWFSPSLSKSVTTNLGIRFLNLVEKHFPKEHKLHKSFNKNTLKVSCSYSQNMTQIINSHNRKVKSAIIKYAIIKYPDPGNLLNKRSEIISKCPHQRRFLSSNYDTSDWNPDR